MSRIFLNDRNYFFLNIYFKRFQTLWFLSLRLADRSDIKVNARSITEPLCVFFSIVVFSHFIPNLLLIDFSVCCPHLLFLLTCFDLASVCSTLALIASFKQWYRAKGMFFCGFSQKQLN